MHIYTDMYTYMYVCIAQLYYHMFHNLTASTSTTKTKNNATDVTLPWALGLVFLLMNL